MDFGRVTDIQGIDFTLPKSDHFLIPPASGEIEILLGATGWSMPQWKGSLYPKKIQPKNFGAVYSTLFPTIEFNTTFYQIPKIEQVEKWYDNTRPEFVFCPKMFAGISQSQSLGIGSELLPDFLDRMTLFKEKLGLIFMQVPQSFSPTKWEYLESFVRHWQTGIPLSLELRHPDWFSEEMGEMTANLLASHPISWLITDVAGRRDVSHNWITAPFMAIRFVGTGDDDSDRQRIEDWAERLTVWSEHGVKVVYFFLHSPENLRPHTLSHWFAEAWARRTGQELAVPRLEKGLFDE